MMSTLSDADLGSSVGTVALAVLIAAMGFFVGFALTFAAVFALTAVGVAVQDDLVLYLIVSVVMLQGIGFGSVGLGYLYLRDDGFDLLMIDWPGIGEVVWFGLGIVALFGALIAVTLLQLTLGIESAEHELVGYGLETPGVLLVMIPLSILLVGPGEELLFRGIIQQLLRDRFGVAVGIGLASVIFSVAHVSSLQGEGLLATLVTYVVLSVILGVVYEYSENLVVPALIHGSFNAVQFLALYAVAAYNIEPALFLIG